MKKLLEIPQREAFPLSENTIDILIESAHKYNGGVFILDCQRQLENIICALPEKVDRNYPQKNE